MWAIVIALAVLMWLWGAVCVHLVNKLADSVPVQFVQKRAYAGALMAVGCAALAVLPYGVLPHSVLSAGWTRELLEQGQRYALLCVVLTAVLAWVRAWRVFTPPVAVAIKPVLKAKPPLAKRPVAAVPASKVNKPRSVKPVEKS